jgi:hypothetical protein
MWLGLRWCIPEGGDPYFRVRLEYGSLTVTTVLASVLPSYFHRTGLRLVTVCLRLFYAYFTVILRLFYAYFTVGYGYFTGGIRLVYGYFTAGVRLFQDQGTGNFNRKKIPEVTSPVLTEPRLSQPRWLMGGNQLTPAFHGPLVRVVIVCLFVCRVSLCWSSSRHRRIFPRCNGAYGAGQERHELPTRTKIWLRMIGDAKSRGLNGR